MQMYTDDTRECMFFIHFLQPLLWIIIIIRPIPFKQFNTGVYVLLIDKSHDM